MPILENNQNKTIQLVRRLGPSEGSGVPGLPAKDTDPGRCTGVPLLMPLCSSALWQLAASPLLGFVAMLYTLFRPVIHPS